MSMPTDSGRRNAARGRTRQLPVLPQDVLERPGLHVGPHFVGMDLDALRRVRRYANSLRGGLLKQSDARYRAPDERPQRS